MEYTQEEQAAHQRLWVEALESGKYQQGTGVLHRGDQFCIMGVACDISGLVTWEHGSDPDQNHFDAYTGDGLMYGVAIPESVKAWLGLIEYDGDFYEEGTYYSLVGLNDDDTEFSELAAIIRQEPDGLFE